LEAATSIAEISGTEVALSYRGAAFERAKPKNRDRVAAAKREGRLKVLLGSNVRRIAEKSVILDLPGEALELRNDAVIVSAGGVLPADFLKSVGVEVATKYGTA
jgi:thioredoxin reductase